ncbi:hypothetical protein GCM10009801_81750 [Streptomyces albiaxialis]|uniref:PRL2-23 n=1 Tax=Streptomyces albiaxialis TaxID=329523 RepID=A0ABN2X8U9_9ACTN
MWTTIVAVLGTILGGAVTGALAHFSARSARWDELDERRRSEAIDAVTALARAASDHRRAMWMVREAQITGVDAERVRVLRDESHRTRSEITEPSVRVQLLIESDAVRAVAHEAVHATYAMREAETLEALEDARAVALATHDLMVRTAGAYLA